jgi:hypothetical protein
MEHADHHQKGDDDAEQNCVADCIRRQRHLSQEKERSEQRAADGNQRADQCSDCAWIAQKGIELFECYKVEREIDENAIHVMPSPAARIWMAAGPDADWLQPSRRHGGHGGAEAPSTRSHVLAQKTG